MDIYGNIDHQYTPHVGIYTILYHKYGSYGAYGMGNFILPTDGLLFFRGLNWSAEVRLDPLVRSGGPHGATTGSLDAWLVGGWLLGSRW